jgi:hypothetical protein
LRVENLDVDEGDPLLGDLGLDYEGISAGLRWDFSPFAALKAEFRREEFADTGKLNSFWLQLAFVFDASNSTGSGYLAQMPRMQTNLAQEQYR